MPNLPPSIQSGQSNAPRPTQFTRSNLGTFSPSMGFPYEYGANSIDSIVEKKIAGLSTLPRIIFPTDLPKYNFTIIESEWELINLTGASKAWFGNLYAEKLYKLPFPRELVDKNEVNYDTDFNYLSGLAKMIKDVMNTGGRTISAASGYTINHFKAVTLNVPDFKTHQLSWTLAPKNLDEAKTIQRLIFSLKKGMAPRRGIGGFKATLAFPKIYNLYFSPNPQWLFKFKPTVLTSLVVDYNGGNPTSSFYSGPTDNPPESVTIATNWLELEYWLSEDYTPAVPEIDFPSSDPLSDGSWYTNNGPR